MRALVLTMLLVPAFASAEPCEDLARAICHAKDAVGGCFIFVEEELGGSEGCKGALGDKARVADLRARMKARAETRWFVVGVKVEPKRADGSAWDPGGGAPDLAVCLAVGDEEVGCRPEGKSSASVTRAECVDATRCEFRVHARRGVAVGVDVLDVDEGGAEYVGVCAFTAGRAQGECKGPVSLVLEGGGSGVGSVERRFVGRWAVDVEGTLARDPAFAALGVAERVKAMEVASVALGEAYFEFTADGRVVAKVGEEVKEGRYVVRGLKGETVTLGVREGGEEAVMEVRVVDGGLVVREGETVMVLRRGW